MYFNWCDVWYSGLAHVCQEMNAKDAVYYKRKQLFVSSSPSLIPAKSSSFSLPAAAARLLFANHSI
jgi:hypothetical protein